MPSTIARTYGKKPTTKRKTSPNGDGHGNLKRRRVTPDQREASKDLADSAPGERRSPAAPASPTKSSESSAVATPTKLTKRMLGRSRTESSIDSQISAASPAARTFSMPLIPSSSSQPSSAVEGQSHDHRPPVLKTVSTPRVKHTYAGQSRSFLISLPVGDIGPDAIPGVESQEDEYLEQESYSSLRLRWGVDNSEDDPVPTTPSKSKSKSINGTPSRKGKGKAPTAYLPPNMMNPLKSITELRSKGQSRMFLDEVGYLFEGMDPSNSAGLKRSSASEITMKLCDEEFARKAKAADFYHKTWDVFLKAGAGRGEDRLLDILLVFFVALIARNLDTLIELVRQGTNPHASGTEDKEEYPDTLASILFFILKNSADIDPLAMISATDLEFKQIGLSRKDKVMLSSVHSTISRSSRLFPDNTPVTTALLTTHTLRNLPPDLIPPAHMSDLLHSLRKLFSISFPPNHPFDGGYPLESHREPHYECIRNHLHLLELLLLNNLSRSSGREDDEDQISEDIRAARDVWLLDGLIAIAVCAEIKLREKEVVDSVSECLEVLLRVLVNLTHGDENWTRGVINNPYATTFIIRLLASSGLAQSSSVPGIRPKSEEGIDNDSGDDELSQERPTPNCTFDRLCLALGLLTNLVQSAPEFKHTLQQTKVSPKCSLKDTSCARACSCRGSLNALQILAKVYNKHFPPISDINPPRTKTKSKIKLEPSPTPPPPPVNSDHLSSTTIAEADASLIQATLSILFGLLMDDSPFNQAEILGAMSTCGGDRTKLGKLVEQAKEFVAFYNAINSEKTEEREDGNAGEVVRILEKLRDGC